MMSEYFPFLVWFPVCWFRIEDPEKIAGMVGQVRNISAIPEQTVPLYKTE